MNPTTTILLLVLIAWAMTFYYLYFVKRWRDWGGSGRTALIMLCCVLIPLTLVTLWQQNTAKNRLESIGISIHSQLGSSIGSSAGKDFSDNSWVFEYDGSEKALLDFYRIEANRPDWTTVADSDFMLVLEKGSEQISIGAGDSSALFTLTRKTRE